MPDSFAILDYLVVLAYLGISLGLGFAFRKQSNRDEFFTAGRSMGRMTVGLSVMATPADLALTIFCTATLINTSKSLKP